MGKKSKQEAVALWGVASRCRDESCASASASRCSCRQNPVSQRYGLVPTVAPVGAINCDSRCRACTTRRMMGISLAGSIVPDGVVRSEANPLGDGTVLLLRLGELLLRAERLVALWKVTTRQRRGLSR